MRLYRNRPHMRHARTSREGSVGEVFVLYFIFLFDYFENGLAVLLLLRFGFWIVLTAAHKVEPHRFLMGERARERTRSDSYAKAQSLRYLGE